VIVALVVVGVLLLMCIAAGGVLVAVFLPAVNAAREAGRRNLCTNQLKMIGIAMHNYQATYKTFPPASITDANGKPMHSWRVLILPFMEGPDLQSLYGQYDFNEPWDGPHNSKLAGLIGNVYTCPSDPTTGSKTSYVAVVGPETAWPGTSGIRLRDITDGMSNTILLVEVADAGIPWMEPRDLSFDEATNGAAASHHPAGFHALFCDGSVHFLNDDLSPAALRGLLTAGGGEAVEAEP
jgi:hypothetical protein